MAASGFTARRCGALREYIFANHICADLDAVERSLTDGLRALEAEPRTRTIHEWIRMEPLLCV